MHHIAAIVGGLQVEQFRDIYGEHHPKQRIKGKGGDDHNTTLLVGVQKRSPPAHQNLYIGTFLHPLPLYSTTLQTAVAPYILPLVAPCAAMCLLICIYRY